MLPGIKLFDLTGKSAIVTGGSKGLGLAMAAGLASAGADVLLASRTEGEAAAAAEEIAKDFGHKSLGVRADVTSPEDVAAMTDRALAEFGKIDILINNAGVNIRGPIDEVSYEDFKKVQDINVGGVWLCAGGGPSHEGREVRADRQPREHFGRGGACRPHALHRQQRGSRANDPGLGVGTRPL